jgi:hypothetical protein
VGPGMGATQLGWTVMSIARAAGLPLMRTVPEHFMRIPGPAGMQVGNMQGIVMSPMRAAGIPPMITGAVGGGSGTEIVNGNGG